MALGYGNRRKETITKANGNTIGNMGKDYLNIEIAHTRESSKISSKTAEDNRNLRMETNMKDSISKVGHMAKVGTSGKMEGITKDSLTKE